MSRISDNLREQARHLWDDGRHMSLDSDQLFGLADRIDAEMVEWPLGADKKPIKPSQTVYKAINGDDGEYVVHSLRCSVPGWVALIKRVGTDSSCIVRPDVLTHERPDSLERIADELDAWTTHAAEKCWEFGVEEDALHGFADRIRKLEEEREHERE